MGLIKFEPLIYNGKVPLFFLKVAPNSSRGLIILFISLFFKDLSPVILITLGEFIKAALGKDASKLLDTPIVLLASELLPIFVKADINGAAAPATQNPWSGRY